MNAWTRFIRSAYRKEPISSFILTVGAADAVIGGIGMRWSLFSLGLVVALLAIALRWWQVQKAQPIIADDSPRHFLPPQASRPPLPMLTQEGRRR